MKLIVRADDVGYTVIHNEGTFRTLEHGITTSCDLMLDTPGFADACRRLRDYPWISIGWHTHFGGRPVLSASEVPSMVDEAGRFKWRKDRTLMQTVDYDEAVRECRVQLERCRDLLGRIPDTWSMGGFHNPLNKAIETVCDEYGIAHDFLQGIGYNGKKIVCKEEYLDKRLYEITLKDSSYIKSLKVEDFPFYHPAEAMMAMPVEEDKIAMFSRHPGFLDDYVLAESSCTLPRVKDVEALCDERVIQWIIDNRIELVNHRDALYGTNEYQEHLKETGSPLYLEK